LSHCHSLHQNSTCETKTAPHVNILQTSSNTSGFQGFGIIGSLDCGHCKEPAAMWRAKSSVGHSLSWHWQLPWNAKAVRKPILHGSN
jgi:hypothetical protein